MVTKSTICPAIAFSDAGLVRCLGSAGIPVYAGSDIPHNTALYSRYTKRKLLFSSYDSDEFIDELIALGKTLDFRPILLSYDDRLLLNISVNRDRLLPYYHFLLPDHEMVEGLLDKQKFISLSEEYGLPTPASVRVSQKEDLQKVPRHLDPPYLIKPIFRHLWFDEKFTQLVGSYKKAFVCASMDDLKKKYDQISGVNPAVVIQEYIEGPDNSMYDVNMYVDAQGKIKGTIITHKIRVYPQTAGYGSFVMTVADQELLTLSKDIVRELQLVGLVNLQFKREELSNEPKLIEIHPRTSIFDLIGIKAGVNLPAIYHWDMQDMTVPYVDYKIGVKYVHPGRDMLLYLKNGKEEGITLFSLLKSYSGHTVFDGFSVQDPKPIAMNFWWRVRDVLPSGTKEKSPFTKAPT